MLAFDDGKCRQGAGVRPLLGESSTRSGFWVFMDDAKRPSNPARVGQLLLRGQQGESISDTDGGVARLWMPAVGRLFPAVKIITCDALKHAASVIGCCAQSRLTAGSPKTMHAICDFTGGPTFTHVSRYVDYDVTEFDERARGCTVRGEVKAEPQANLLLPVGS